MKNNMITIKMNNSITSRQELLDNTQHTVYPVIMINEGVHNRVLYTEDELNRTVQNWNNAPISINHPNDQNGNPISCNSPDVHNKQVIGKVFNVHMDSKNLKGELYINNNKANQLLPDLFTFIENEGKMEVSTGLFSDDIHQNGVFNGEEYDSIAVNILADHLALLTNSVGACSWSDGCGIRTNKDKKEDFMTKKKEEDFVKNNKEFLLPTEDERFKTNEADYDKILGLVYSKMDAMDVRDEKYHYPIKVYNDRVIYRINYRDATSPKLMQRNYQLNEYEDSITWINDPIEVVRNETFTPKTNIPNTNNNTQKENKMTSKIKTMKECCPDSVNQFIKENEQYKDNEEVIMGLSEDQFKVLMKTVEIKQPKTNSEKDYKNLSFDEVIDAADDETKESIQMGKRMLKQHRDGLIKTIKSNSSNEFSDDELEKMNISTLEKMSNLARTENVEVNDYGMQFPVMKQRTNAEEAVHPMPDPTFDEDIIKK